MVLQFVSTLIIARYLGVEEMGVYSVYLAWVMVLAGVISLGTPSYAMKSVSVYYSRTQFAAIKGLLSRLSGFVAVAAGLLGLLFLLSELVIEGYMAQITTIDQPWLLVVGAFCFVLLRLVCEILKSIDRVNTSVFVESASIALLMLLGVALLKLYTNDLPSANSVIVINILVSILVGTLALFVLLRVLNKSSDNTFPEIPGLSNLGPFWGNFLLVMAFINAPMVMLPLLASEQEIGQFSIAYRLIMIMVNLLGVLAAIFGPKFARAAADGDYVKLSRLVNKSSLFSLAVYIPVATLLAIFPTQILSFFGDGFEGGANNLLIMLLGQSIYASTGLVGMCLAMSGKAALEFRLSLVGVTVMYGTIWILGNAYGATGVAVGFAFSLALKNLLSWVFVRRTISTLKLQTRG
jgi:O-antigen/teichoic acid export membrane protein